MLEHHADLAAGQPQLVGVHVSQFVGAHCDRAGVRPFEQVHRSDESALARTALADDPEDLTRRNVEAHVLQCCGDGVAGTEGLGNMADGNHRKGTRSRGGCGVREVRATCGARRSPVCQRRRRVRHRVTQCDARARAGVALG